MRNIVFFLPGLQLRVVNGYCYAERSIGCLLDRVLNGDLKKSPARIELLIKTKN